mmetsp:Transcript_36065/g.60773  ORF Transcript_36065/g.60773 Transcript_36065/m.60773 type:complete len:253 (+) Transcript_36065:398-1156(+)
MANQASGHHRGAAAVGVPVNHFACARIPQGLPLVRARVVGPWARCSDVCDGHKAAGGRLRARGTHSGHRGNRARGELGGQASSGPAIRQGTRRAGRERCPWPTHGGGGGAVRVQQLHDGGCTRLGGSGRHSGKLVHGGLRRAHAGTRPADDRVKSPSLSGGHGTHHCKGDRGTDPAGAVFERKSAACCQRYKALQWCVRPGVCGLRPRRSSRCARGHHLLQPGRYHGASDDLLPRGGVCGVPLHLQVPGCCG